MLGRLPWAAIGAVGAVLAVVACDDSKDAGTAGSASSDARAGAPAASEVVNTEPGSADTTAPAITFAGDDSWIAFQRIVQDNSLQVWLVHPDGSGEHQVLTDVADDVRYPAWSPDGGRLVVASIGGPIERLYEYDLATSTSRVPISCDACAADEPSYSPDGNGLLFELYDGGSVFSADVGGEVPADCGLATQVLATGEISRLTSNTEPPCDREYGPRWSPDGSQIVYTRDPYEAGRPQGTSVYVVDADGTNERRLTDPSLPMGEAAWSPDGAWIVMASYPLFEYGTAPEPSNLYRIRPDGTGLEQLTFNSGSDPRATIPSFSPDGAWIVFTSVTATGRDLAAIPADGGGVVVLVAGSEGHNFTAPVWQPER